MSSGLIERLKKSSKVEAQFMADHFQTERTMIKTNLRALNLLLSGKYFGGFYTGITLWAAPSRHFKTMFLLLQMKAYLDSDPDAIAVFYDSENGAAKAYFDTFDIDLDRVLWKEIMNLEEFKFDLANMLENDIKQGEKVFIGVDSIGNMASKKEVEDALKESGAADMTRAKQLRSIFRIILPYITKRDIPFVAVNHTYDVIGSMSHEKAMGGGQGPLLASDSVLFITKSTNKNAEGVEGFNFTASAYKSRFIREKAKIPITVSFDSGIDPTSGLLDLGLMTGTIEKVGHRYRPVLMNKETGEVIEAPSLFKKDQTIEWFDDMATNPHSEFLPKIEEYFQLASTKVFDDSSLGDSI